MEVPASKTVRTQQVVPMAQMGAETLTRLGEELATKQELKVHLHSACSSPDDDSAVILERAAQVEGRNIQAAGLETLLRRRTRVRLAISTLRRLVLLEVLRMDPQTWEVMLLRIVEAGLRLACPRQSLALVVDSD